jgi:hypothetical protein
MSQGIHQIQVSQEREEIQKRKKYRKTGKGEVCVT